MKHCFQNFPTNELCFEKFTVQNFFFRLFSFANNNVFRWNSKFKFLNSNNTYVEICRHFCCWKCFNGKRWRENEASKREKKLLSEKLCCSCEHIIHSISSITANKLHLTKWITVKNTQVWYEWLVHTQIELELTRKKTHTVYSKTTKRIELHKVLVTGCNVIYLFLFSSSSDTKR